MVTSGAKKGTYYMFHPNMDSLCVICIDTFTFEFKNMTILLFMCHVSGSSA